MALNRSVADAVEAIARRLIPLHHPNLEKHAVPFAWRFRDDEPQRNGQPVWHAVKVLKGDVAFELTQLGADVGEGGMVLVYVSGPVWNGMSADQQEAMVDEILCSVSAGLNEETDKTIIKTVAPDFKAYYANLERYGYWHTGVRAVVKALEHAAQLALPLDEEVEAASTEGEAQEFEGEPVAAEPSDPEQVTGRRKKRSKLAEWQEGQSGIAN
jgi:hypothetical protein